MIWCFQKPVPLWGLPLAVVASLALCFCASINLGAGLDNALHQELRWLRSVAALMVGAALGVAGVMMQQITRNNLAEPGLLGVNAGAALGVVTGLSFFAIESSLAYLAAAFIGALAGKLCVLAIAQRQAQPQLHAASQAPMRLLLAGVALAASFQGFSAALLLRQANGLDQYRFWILGSLAGVSPEMLWLASPLILFALLASLLMARPLAALALGDDQARSLGHQPARSRLLLIIVTSLLTASAVALAGPVAFLGLLAPFLARMLLRTRTTSQASMAHLLVMAALCGASLMLLADIAARMVAIPFETPLSSMTACLGAPVLIWLARSNNVDSKS